MATGTASVIKFDKGDVGTAKVQIDALNPSTVDTWLSWEAGTDVVVVKIGPDS
jgi:hypothetical protein